MKKIFLLIALFYSISFCQGWNATVTTSINEGAFTQMDLFTNKDGNHLVIKKTTGDIVYYNINSSGDVDSSKTEILNQVPISQTLSVQIIRFMLFIKLIT